MIRQLISVANRLDHVGLFQYADQIDQIIKMAQDPELQELRPAEPTKFTITHTNWKDAVSYPDMRNYIGNLGAGLTNTSQQVYDYLKLLTFLLKHKYPSQQVHITSGKRSGEKQVKIMMYNWKRNGGKTPLRKPYNMTIGGQSVPITTKGMVYLLGLYENSRMAYAFGKSMEDGRIQGMDPLAYWTRYFERRSGATHVSGNAIDFRSDPSTAQILQESKKHSSIEIVDETGSASPHYHVSVHSVPDGQIV